MATIEMNVERCGHDGWHPDGTRMFERVSRWMKVKHNYNPSKRNPLWDYVMDGYGYKPYQEKFDPSEGLYLDYFTFEGKNYAIEQFLALGNPFWTAVSYTWQDKDGKWYCLSGIDGEPLFDPIYIELDEYGENVRVYREVA